jgi:galactonate dehydratase
MSVIVKATAADGPSAGARRTASRARGGRRADRRLLAPFVVGRDARDAAAIWQDLYDLQRVRGASGGYMGDALAGIDIALCDLAARAAGVPLHAWLGTSSPAPIPAYVSGLPRATLPERVALAREFVARGFRRSSTQRRSRPTAWCAEMRALREALGGTTSS